MLKKVVLLSLNVYFKHPWFCFILFQFMEYAYFILYFICYTFSLTHLILFLPHCNPSLCPLSYFFARRYVLVFFSIYRTYFSLSQFTLLRWWRTRHCPPKHWHLSTTIPGLTLYKTADFVLIADRTYNRLGILWQHVSNNVSSLTYWACRWVPAFRRL